MTMVNGADAVEASAPTRGHFYRALTAKSQDTAKSQGLTLC
jgi:hypothetical protein